MSQDNIEKWGKLLDNTKDESEILKKAEKEVQDKVLKEMLRKDFNVRIDTPHPELDVTSLTAQTLIESFNHPVLRTQLDNTENYDDLTIGVLDYDKDTHRSGFNPEEDYVSATFALSPKAQENFEKEKETLKQDFDYRVINGPTKLSLPDGDVSVPKEYNILVLNAKTENGARELYSRAKELHDDNSTGRSETKVNLGDDGHLTVRTAIMDFDKVTAKQEKNTNLDNRILFSKETAIRDTHDEIYENVKEAAQKSYLRQPILEKGNGIDSSLQNNIKVSDKAVTNNRSLSPLPSASVLYDQIMEREQQTQTRNIGIKL